MALVAIVYFIICITTSPNFQDNQVYYSTNFLDIPLLFNQNILIYQPIVRLY